MALDAARRYRSETIIIVCDGGVMCRSVVVMKTTTRFIILLSRMLVYLLKSYE